MAWRATIEKYHAASGEFWTNVYGLKATTMADAISAANLIVTNEKGFHCSVVTFTKFRVDDGVPDTDMYHTQALSGIGERLAGTDVMPLFVALRVDINTVGGGRPSRKYYRGCLLEGDVNGMTVTNAAFLSGVSAQLTGIAGDILQDPDGQFYGSAVAMQRVGMRQLRRGTKKKTTP